MTLNDWLDLLVFFAEFGGLLSLFALQVFVLLIAVATIEDWGQPPTRRNFW